MTVIEVPFNEEVEDGEPKPLRMEHFYFPLGMWVVGILLSVFCLLAELIIHRLRKSKTDIPMEEVEHNSDVDIEDID